MFKKIILLLVCFVFSYKAKAIEIYGHDTQGGLLALRYDFQSTKAIKINRKKLELDSDGLIYYPVNRNAKKLYVSQLLKNGTIVRKFIKIKQRDFQVQNVKGVKSQHVTPDKGFLARINKESKQIKKSRTWNSPKFFDTLLPQFKIPLDGKTTGVYGSKRFYNGIEKSWHKGWDIAREEKTPIKTPLKGKVVLAMKDSFYNGNLVIIDHGKKIYTIYAHMYDILVKKGSLVNPGDVIGLVGSTGRSTGPHLHWGVYVGQQAIDPELLVKKGR